MNNLFFLRWPDPDEPGGGETEEITAEESTDESSPEPTDQPAENPEQEPAEEGPIVNAQPGDLQQGGSGQTDQEGFKMISGGTWNQNTTLNIRGGQAMHFQVRNVNALGTTITIESNLGGKKSMIILPQQTADIRFDCFGREPMSWTFNISSDSDAFVVAWKLFSSWAPGDPPNG